MSAGRPLELPVQLPRLCNTNYRQWSVCVRVYLESKDLWDIVEGAPPPSEEDVNDSTSKEDRQKDAQARTIILNSVDHLQFQLITDMTTARSQWNRLKEVYSASVDMRLIQLLRQFYQFEAGTRSVDEIVTRLNDLQFCIGQSSPEDRPSDRTKTMVLMDSLPEGLAVACTVLSAAMNDLSFEKVVARLKEEELTRQMDESDDGRPPSNVVLEPNNHHLLSPTRSNSPANIGGASHCFFCGEVGHWPVNCNSQPEAKTGHPNGPISATRAKTEGYRGRNRGRGGGGNERGARAGKGGGRGENNGTWQVKERSERGGGEPRGKGRGTNKRPPPAPIIEATSTSTPPPPTSTMLPPSTMTDDMWLATIDSGSSFCPSEADEDDENWYNDSGASRHMTPHRRAFIRYEPLRQAIPVRLANGDITFAIGQGDLSIHFSNQSLVCKSSSSSRKEAITEMNKQKPREKHIVVSDVLHVPDLYANILSVLTLNGRGIRVLHDVRETLLYRGDVFLAKATYSRGRCVLDRTFC